MAFEGFANSFQFSCECSSSAKLVWDMQTLVFLISRFTTKLFPFRAICLEVLPPRNSLFFFGLSLFFIFSNFFQKFHKKMLDLAGPWQMRDSLKGKRERQREWARKAEDFEYFNGKWPQKSHFLVLLLSTYKYIDSEFCTIVVVPSIYIVGFFP